jgi:L-threonylcarbamoyladenylate synthase
VLTARDAQQLDACVQAGGVALFGADTVYGLACDPEQPAAVQRLYALKGRPLDQPSAVMFFSLAAAQAALPELGHLEREIRALLPGAVTLLLPNPRRLYPLACGSAPEVLGLRVPRLRPPAAALANLSRPILQSSANRSGAPDARRLADVDGQLRSAADLVLDGGELPGLPSTVVDLRELSSHDPICVVREGAVSRAELARSLGRTGTGG